MALEKSLIFAGLGLALLGAWQVLQPSLMVFAHQIVPFASQVRILAAHPGEFGAQPYLLIEGDEVENAVAATWVEGSNACSMCGDEDNSHVHEIQFWKNNAKIRTVWMDEKAGEVSSDGDDRKFMRHKGCQQYLSPNARLYWQNLLHQARVQIKGYKH